MSARKARSFVTAAAAAEIYSLALHVALPIDTVSADVKSKAEAAIADAKKALEGSDVEAIKAAGESLQSVAYELAQVVYADAQQQTDGAAGAQSADDDVVDADYEVVDDEDK